MSQQQVPETQDAAAVSSSVSSETTTTMTNQHRGRQQIYQTQTQFMQVPVPAMNLTGNPMQYYNWQRPQAAYGQPAAPNIYQSQPLSSQFAFPPSPKVSFPFYPMGQVPHPQSSTVPPTPTQPLQNIPLSPLTQPQELFQGQSVSRKSKATPIIISDTGVDKLAARETPQLLIINKEIQVAFAKQVATGVYVLDEMYEPQNTCHTSSVESSVVQASQPPINRVNEEIIADEDEETSVNKKTTKTTFSTAATLQSATVPISKNSKKSGTLEGEKIKNQKKHSKTIKVANSEAAESVNVSVPFFPMNQVPPPQWLLDKIYGKRNNSQPPSGSIDGAKKEIQDAFTSAGKSTDKHETQLDQETLLHHSNSDHSESVSSPSIDHFMQLTNSTAKELAVNFSNEKLDNKETSNVTKSDNKTKETILTAMTTTDKDSEEIATHNVENINQKEEVVERVNVSATNQLPETANNGVTIQDVATAQDVITITVTISFPPPTPTQSTTITIPLHAIRQIPPPS